MFSVISYPNNISFRFRQAKISKHGYRSEAHRFYVAIALHTLLLRNVLNVDHVRVKVLQTYIAYFTSAGMRMQSCAPNILDKRSLKQIQCTFFLGFIKFARPLA